MKFTMNNGCAARLPAPLSRAASLLLVAGVLAPLAPASAQVMRPQWVEDAAGVWVVQGNGAFQKQRYNPAGGVIGNMGNAGVVFEVGAAPGAGAVRAAREAAAAGGFGPWNALATPRVRINFRAQPGGMNPPATQIPISWAAIGAPGDTTLGAGPTESIRLHNTRSLRTDGWSLDFAGNRPNAMIDEYDVHTTAVHEIGHSLGLGHPAGVVTQVMTPQNTARRDANSTWRANEWGPGTQNGALPAALRDLNGAALPATTLGYQNPRGALGAGDALGAATMYSAPMGRVGGAAMPAPGGGGGRPDYEYTYSLENHSDDATGYWAREARIPVHPDVNVNSLTAPSGWSIERLSDVVRVYFNGDGGVMPDSLINFSFIADQPPVMTQPVVRWLVDGLTPIASPGDDDGEGRFDTSPLFDPLDFGVMDEGRFTYRFDSGLDAWQTVLMDRVVTPVPAPGCIALLISGGVMAMARRRR